MKDIDLICITVDIEYEKPKRWYDHLNYLNNINIFNFNYERL